MPHFTKIPVIQNKIKVTKRGCWEWTGAKINTGYGVVRVDRKLWLVHRYVYTVAVREIPDGKQIDHFCRNRLCCNPAHLEVVDNKTNSRRAISSTIARTGKCRRGHVVAGDNVYVRRNGQEECRACRDVRARIKRAKVEAGDRD